MVAWLAFYNIPLILCNAIDAFVIDVPRNGFVPKEYLHTYTCSDKPPLDKRAPQFQSLYKELKTVKLRYMLNAATVGVN